MSYLITRFLCSFISGALLSQSGSLIQLSSKNILASPSTLGIDGLVVLWILVIHSFSLWLGIDLQWMMLSGFLAFVAIGFLFSKLFEGKRRYERIVLLGITFNLAVGAVFSLWQFLFLAFNLSFPVELWFGHFRFVALQDLSKLIIVEFIFLIFLKKLWSDLQLFTLGSNIARNFGLDEKKLLSFIFIFVAVSTFSVVSSFGSFSFLGLVFPLIARKLWFKKFDLSGEIILGSVMNGAAFAMLDYLCYEFPILGAEIPVGLIVTGVGAVSLILILLNSNDREFLAKTKK